MELHEKIQALRKQRNLTQEELAQALFVSRTAVSKWESGRGYPSIDSLKALSGFFSVTIDDLLSGDELLAAAQADTRQREAHVRSLVFGLLDSSTALFFFLPLFGQQSVNRIRSVSLLSLTGISPWLKAVYVAVISGLILWGTAMLALQNCRKTVWIRHSQGISLLLNAAGVLLFIISSQPYAASLLFFFLILKAVLLKKPQ